MANQMNGEANLRTLLQNMRPELQDGEYVFCSLEPAVVSELCLSPIGQFLEEEGLTLILAKDEAEANHLDFTFPCRKITLKVHSSLDAIGFLAIVTEKLAEHGISVNAISAYFHDHLFVPSEKAEDAIRVLSDVVEQSRRS
ncbi:ACT domain protein [Roseimaritima multifibrata]|uniref:ACT domain protein n=1 Tax=Roseimaritima multifibrata TaxID=1930274 RepID=A0A517MIQ1_9BACT|nr:ACT domain-containing protein [Roseimaritima multifibrata]QDS94677.1 ACT domain protein [Roseimaritima multifibrata]